jgi:hypothetical protein
VRGKLLFLTLAVLAGVLITALYFRNHDLGPRAETSGESSDASPDASMAPDSAAIRDSGGTQVVEAPSQPNPAVDAASHDSAHSFRDLRRCVYASRDLINAKHINDCSSYEGQPQFQGALAECLNGRKNARNRIASAEAVLARCDEADVGKRYFEATKEAARRGDPDAQMCYLQGDFFSPEGAQIFSDSEIQAYKKDSPSYVESALKRGDWRIVHLLNTRQFHPGSGPVRFLEGIGERSTRYKMTRLLRLGASGTYAKVLDGQLHDMKHPDLDPSAALPLEVTREGDSWAQKTFTDYFAGRPGLTEAPVVCAPESGQPGSLPDAINPEGS